MTSLTRRRMLANALGFGVAGVTGGALLRSALAQGAPRVIEMTARRFQFEPNEIALKAGERVVLAIRSIDFMHGMNIPDLGVRKDLVPGQITRVELQPKAPGVIDFLCDNFCGDGHETMNGRFIVTA